MQTTHFKGKCEFAAILACALGLIVSFSAHAQAPAPAKAPAKAAAPAAAPPPAAPVAPPPAPAAPPVVAPAPVAPPPPEFAPQASPIVAPAAAPIAGSAAYTLPPESAPVPWGKGKPTGPRELPLFWGGYEISMPMGDLRDFSNKPSFRGFEFGTLWPVFRSLYVGGVFDYHVFSEELGKTTYQIDSGALTANLYRYSRFWSFAGIARYVFLKPDSVFRPFVGVRMGMTFLVNATLVSDLSLYDAPVGFALSPEAGFLAKVAPVMDLSGAIRYDFSTASVDSRKLDNASFLTFQFALVFHPRRP